MDIGIAKRIIQIRKANNLTQTVFAKRLNATRPKVAAYELAKVNFDSSFLTLICKEFNVNETWLRTGEGEMFVQPETFSLDEYAKQKKLTPLELDLLKSLMDIEPEVREIILHRLKEVFNKHTEIATTAQERNGEYDPYQDEEIQDFIKAKEHEKNIALSVLQNIDLKENTDKKIS